MATIFLKLLASTGFMATVAVAAHFIGKLILGNSVRNTDRCIQWIMHCCTGLVLISYSIFILVQLNWISPTTLWIIWITLALLTGVSCYQSRGRLPLLKNFSEAAFWTFAILYFACLTVLSALPATAKDELVYHLQIPRLWLVNHGSTTFHDNIYGYFPQFSEMFFLLGLGTFGEPAAKLFHVLAGFLLCLTIYRVCLRWMSSRYALLATVCFATIPSVMVIASWAYVDLIFTLYGLLAFLALDSFLEDQNRRWIIIAGIFAGSCICIKYTGIQLSLLLVFTWLAAGIYFKNRPRLSHLVLFGTVLLLIASPYFIRNYLQTGWPLFPFPTRFLPLNSMLNWDPDRARLYLEWLQIIGTPSNEPSLLHNLKAPFEVFLFSQFESPRYYSGYVGPVFLLIPFLLVRRITHRDLYPIIFFSLGFVYYWAFTTKQVRFLIPVLPFLCILLFYGLYQVRRPWLVGIVLVLLLANIIVGLTQISRKAPLSYLTNRVSKADYLTDQTPVFQIYQKANRLLKPGDKAYLIHMKNYGYYLDVNWEADYVFERYRFQRWLDQSVSPKDVGLYFSEKHVSHLIIDHGTLFSTRFGLRDRDRALFEAFLRTECRLLAQDHTYALYRIKPGLQTQASLLWK